MGGDVTGGEFTGWPEAAFDVLLQLEGDPSVAVLERHRADRERLVGAPMDALCADLADGYHGDGHVWGMHRDPWLWQHQCAHFTVARRIQLMLRFDLDGLAVEGGWGRADSGQLERYRAAVAADATGRELAGLVAELHERGYEVTGDTTKRVPRDHPPDHPRADLLRHRSLMAQRHLGCDAWLHKPEAVDRVRAAFEDLRPLTTWLATHVAGEPPAA